MKALPKFLYCFVFVLSFLVVLSSEAAWEQQDYTTLNYYNDGCINRDNDPFFCTVNANGGPGTNGPGCKSGGGDSTMEIKSLCGSTAGNPIDPSKTSKLELFTDFDIPLAGGLSFHLDRLYSSAMTMGTRIDDFQPMFGLGWYCNLETRLLASDANSGFVCLPDSRIRTYSRNDNEDGPHRWRSIVEREGDFYFYLFWDGVNSEYRLETAHGEYLYYNKRGRFIRYTNAQGNSLEVERELCYDSVEDVTYDRIDMVKGPEADGRYLQFYYGNQGNPNLVTKIELRTEADGSYVQVLAEYLYHTETAQVDLLARVLNMGTNSGTYYEYGSWDPVQEEIVTLGQETWMRSLAEIGNYVDGSKRPTQRYSYRAGGVNPNYWYAFEPHQEWVAVYDEQDPDNADHFELLYTLSYVHPEEDISVRGSLHCRVYRGDFGGPYTEMELNPYRLPMKWMHSSGYASFNKYIVWPYERDFGVKRNISEIGSISADGQSSELQMKYDYPMLIEETYDPQNHFAHGNLRHEEDHLGRRTTYDSYDSEWNLPTQITDPYGRETTIEYHEDFALPILVEYPDGRQVGRTYNSYGNLISATDSFTNETVNYEYYDDDDWDTYSSSGGGLLARIYGSKRETVLLEYDYLGHVTERTVGSRSTTYDWSGNLLLHVCNGVICTTNEYDDLGRKVSASDPEGNTTTYTYDGLGRLVKVTDDDSYDTKYTYDAYSQLIALCDARDATTEYGYDAAGRIIAETDDLDNVTTYEYADTSGCAGCGGGSRLEKKIDPKGQTTTFSYVYDQDDWHRETVVEYYATGDDPLVDDPVRSVTYEYGTYYNNVEADVLTGIIDDALPFSNQSYDFEYDSELRLKKVIHPEGYYEEYFYDATDGKLVARRDVDGGVTEYAYDSPNNPQRLASIFDPWGNSVSYGYYGSSDPDGPFNALETIAYSNDAWVEYKYDTLGRLDVLTNYASDESVMSSFDYTYDLNGNVTRIDLEDDDAWVYEYDDLNRVTMEKRVDASGPSDVTRWYRAYGFDGVGNRIGMEWYNGTNYITTDYTYNDLNQLTVRDEQPGTDHYYYYDANGNMDLDCDSYQNSLSWTIDNRLKQVGKVEDTIITQYEYDYQGARILRRDNDGTRTRYFFNGITEEVVKESVDGAHTDTAFEFVEKEDGESASEWYTYNGPGGANISSAYDTEHRSDVIACSGYDGNIFIIGDMDGANLNPNDSSWDSTDRVLSFWYRGDWAGIRIALSTVSGTKILFYHSTAGTDYLDGSGHVHYYLGTSAESGSWQRFERNIEADFEAYSTTNAWTNTDGMRIVFSSGDGEFQIDDIKLSNAMTKTFNALTGGSVGQIAATYDFSDGAPIMDVAWYCYDHIGNVQGLSDTNGDLASSTYQDAYGNVLSSITTGQWASSFDGRHLTTKEHDADSELYYFWQRWCSSEEGSFLSKAPMPPNMEHPYAYCHANPVMFVDPNGRMGVGMKFCLACLAGVGIGQTAGCVSGCWGASDFWGCFKDCMGGILDDPMFKLTMVICGGVCGAGIGYDEIGGPQPPSPGEDYDYDLPHPSHNGPPGDSDHVHPWEPHPKKPGKFKRGPGRPPKWYEAPIPRPHEPIRRYPECERYIK